MTKWWAYLLLFFFSFHGTTKELYGQTTPTQPHASTPANLSASYNKKVADSLFNLGSKYQDAQAYKQSLVVFETSLKLYRLIGDRKKVGNCFNYMAITYFYLGDFPKAIVNFKQGAESFKTIRYKKGVASTLNNIGAVYKNQGNYLKALDSYRQAALIWGEIKDTEYLATTTQNIGAIYAEAKDYSNAMKHYSQAYDVYRKKNNQQSIAQVLDEIGKIYTKQAKYSKAFESLNGSLKIADKREDKQLQVMVLSSLGNLFYKCSDYTQALTYYSRCLTYSNQIGNVQNQSESQIAIGNILHRLGKHAEAIIKCQNGLKLAEKLSSVSIKKSGCECLYHSYKSSGNTQQALHYYERANAFEDSLNLAETANKVMGMEFQKQQLVDSIAYVKKEHIIQLKHKEEVQRGEKTRNMVIISLCFVLLIAGGLWNRLNYVRKSGAALKIEKDRSDALLLNILPEEIAEELKAKGSVSARDYDLVSILFTDFKSFTQTAEQMSPQQLVEEINMCFKAFDLITANYQIEKIKTIGDAYMAAGGMPKADEDSTRKIVLAGLEMQAFITNRALESQLINRPAFEMRVGIHVGPIVAGIVGVKKFQYDVWGDTVNTASRMESSGMVGKVNISETLYELIKDEDCFTFEYRGHVHAKGKGDIAMYYVEKCSIS